MLIKDHFDGKLIKDWRPIENSEFQEVSELNNICFSEFQDLDYILTVQETIGEIYRLYSYEHNKIIGYAVYGQVFNDNSAYVLRIGILPEVRRQGYASYILDCIIIDLAQRKPKCPNIYCDIRQSNTASMNLFRKNGFQLAEVRGEVYPDGELSNCMHLRLAS